MENPELIFIPAPSIGHLVSTVQFAESLIDRDERLSMTVIVLKMPLVPDLESYVQSLAASDTRIRYITLPLSTNPPSLDFLECPENYFHLYVESHKPQVKDAISQRVDSCSTRLAGLVIDFSCTSMIDLANEFSVPSYIFCPSSAAFLGLMNHLPNHRKTDGNSFVISDPDLTIPTYSLPVPSSVLPSVYFSKTGADCFLYHGSRFKETNGFIINTFSELEPYAVNALVSDEETPPIYAVGPLVDLKNARKGTSVSEHEQIIKWLDGQPSSSVVFLCFGSFGGFEPPQLMQIAIALEKSGLRFLWSIHHAGLFEKVGISSIDELLPEGFSEKTRDRGMICGWAPQVNVLAHEAIGCFVSHCGWNSILESLSYGVPVVTWPTYAEQQIVAFAMVKELGLGTELKLDYRIGSEILVGSNEIENAIAHVMDNENPVRIRVKEMGAMSRKAVKDGGSSFVSTGCFIDKIWETSS